MENSCPILDPQPTKHNFAFSARLPDQVLSQIRSGASIRVNKKIRNIDPATFDLIDSTGAVLGTFRAMPSDPNLQKKESIFNQILKKDGDSFVPILRVPPSFTFAMAQIEISSVRDTRKKHTNIPDMLPQEADADLSSLFADWSAKKAYDSLAAMNKRFHYSKKSMIDLLDEFQNAVNANPAILEDPQAIKSVYKDVTNFLKDMHSVTMTVKKFNTSNKPKEN